ncbi:DUF1853 family protein [Marinirhabdus gelatinilytica]|uniref:DUF1853 family protein n=1 Tax=Marinirhabdus gelatinilytica TaxID=1703343 RepID=A0A370Q9S6_9FLAO|nr:DUF1853 family protein [Marinirhabdus gelatinilytica]RDK84770.1 hypothetical protein C8D94_104143 [Marinirhabdus gelatinilytica]
MNTAHYFLKAPLLKLPRAEFPFPFFEISEIKGHSIAFPSEKMLGKQAEFLFESWLNHSQRYQEIAKNIQIQGATETLGELDYIVRDTETKQTLHIELACKFYLLDETLGKHTTQQWIGPNRKDTLVDKLTKMETKQFPLLHRRETVQTLEHFSINISNIQQQYCIKAFVFVPKGYAVQNLPRHFQDCVVGHYISESEFKTEKDTSARYTLPQKREWLLPPESLDNWMSFQEAKTVISQSISEKRSPLVYKKIGGTLERFFVVWW